MRTIKIGEATKRGKTWYRVIEPPSDENPRAKQRWFKSKEKAEALVRSINNARAGCVRELLVLDQRDQLLLAQALSKVGSAQKVFDAVMMFADRLVSERKQLAEVVTECKLAKAAAGCRLAYLTPFELMLDRFGKHCGPKAMHEVTLAEVEKFINAPKAKGGKPSQWTRRARWIDLRTLFSFAVQRGYCRENLPEKIDAIRIDQKAPEIYRPSEAAEGMRQVAQRYPHLIRYAALRLFGGLRPSEALQSKKSDDLGDFISISSAASKGRRRRLVAVTPVLRAWLNLGGDDDLTEARARKIRECFKPWRKNALRHSFVTYHSALHGARSTAAEAGHSEQILHDHYREIATKKSAEEFFGLTPGVVLNRKLELAA